MENSKKNLEDIIMERFVAQDEFINKQHDILKDYNEILKETNREKDGLVKFVLTTTAVSLILILSVFFVSYFCCSSGWDNETKVENKTITENVNKNINE